MNECTFSYNGATITVKGATGKSELDTDVVLYQLGEARGVAENYHQQTYARIVAQSTVDGHLGFDLPTANASAAELRAGFAAFLDAPGPLVRQWKQALNDADAPPTTEPELAPGVETDNPQS